MGDLCRDYLRGRSHHIFREQVRPTLMYEKTDVPNHVIDPESNALLNTDVGGYEAFKAARHELKRRQHNEDVLSDLINRVSQIERILKERE
jgi:hypothetical protein